ncbi:hypothetical protein [Halorarius litoreus]|uniref:hypothetical protein n=1 Tax=Halorarius litoreus TaxID=2962676 RepID=UPI0020CB7D50|nr:hypothetical protein [Halorarius litoreus]
MSRTKRLDHASREVREAEAIRANRRQARALEVIAGVLMMDYLARHDESYSVEELFEEARWRAQGGSL